MTIDNAFPGEWYAGADRPSAPSVAAMRRGIECDALRLHTGPLHPAVEHFVAYYERSGIFDELGAVEGFVAANEAALWLTWAFVCLAQLFAIVIREPCRCCPCPADHGHCPRHDMLPIERWDAADEARVFPNGRYGEGPCCVHGVRPAVEKP